MEHYFDTSSPSGGEKQTLFDVRSHGRADVISKQDRRAEQRRPNKRGMNDKNVKDYLHFPGSCDVVLKWIWWKLFGRNRANDGRR